MPAIRRRDGRRGFAIIYITLTALVLIPMAGLAIDFGMLYNIKARLQTACDAAAIGAGYMLHASTNIADPTQLANITTTAQQYFNANFPNPYMGSTVTAYNASVAGSTSGKSITVTATVNVPMLLMRVLSIKNSTVSAMAVSNVKYIAMMIVVDRSGSVQREGSDVTTASALSTFVASASTSFLVDGVDTVGMVSFGASSRLDFSPTIHFQTGSPNIQTAINNIDYDNNSTNTMEGLYQAWYQLYRMNLPGSLNVILLLTDGRPSGFTANFTRASGSGCNNKTIGGVFTMNVGNPWPPPTTQNGTIYGQGLFNSAYQGTGGDSSYLPPNSSGCAYYNDQTKAANDFVNFPTSVGPVNNVGSISYYTTAGTGLSTQTGYYNFTGTSMTNPQQVRYAAFNAADNLAQKIRQDTTVAPMIFVIGLNYPSSSGEEPLDADFLARIANDPNYTAVGTDSNSTVTAGNLVYQSGQTPGLYCNAYANTTGSLQGCFQQVTSHLLRLMQ